MAKHWQTIIRRQFGVRSSTPYPIERVPVTSPVRNFQYWVCMLSWAACETCGRRDTSLWHPPTFDKGWHQYYPELTKGITCKHKALWQQKCHIPVHILERDLRTIAAERQGDMPILKDLFHSPYQINKHANTEAWTGRNNPVNANT